MPVAKKKPVKKKSVKKRAAPAAPVYHTAFEVRSLEELIRDLEHAIKQRKYDEAARLGNLLLDVSPSEEVDRFTHDIISSANTIRDAEDEIRYQFHDLLAAIRENRQRDIDGL